MPFTPEYVKKNVTRSSDPAQLYASRVKGRQILLDNPVRQNKAKEQREEKKARHANAKKRSEAGVIAHNTARRKDLWKASPTERKYAVSLAQFEEFSAVLDELLIAQI
jgi:ribonuclease P protein subunit POP4